MDHFDKDTRAGYCYLVGTVVTGICDIYETSPDALKNNPIAAQQTIPEPILDMVGFLMSVQGFLLEEDDDRAAYLIHRVLEQVGPVVMEALGVSPSLTKKPEVLN